jgi:hypothetical protein
MVETKTYNIQGHEFTQEELTWAQDQELLQNFAELATKFSDDFSIAEMLKELAMSGKVEKFFQIILHSRDGTELTKDMIGRCKTSFLLKVIDDFLALNAKLADKLKHLGASFALTKYAQQIATAQTKSQTHAEAE